MFDNLPSFSFKVPVIAESFVLPILYSALNYIAPSKALLSSYHFAALLFDCKLFYHHYTNTIDDLASLSNIITFSVINNVFGIIINCGGEVKHYQPFVINLIMKIIHCCALYKDANVVSDSLFYTIEFNKKNSVQSYEALATITQDNCNNLCEAVSETMPLEREINAVETLDLF